MWWTHVCGSRPWTQKKCSRIHVEIRGPNHRKGDHLRFKARISKTVSMTDSPTIRLQWPRFARILSQWPCLCEKIFQWPGVRENMLQWPSRRGIRLQWPISSGPRCLWEIVTVSDTAWWSGWLLWVLSLRAESYDWYHCTTIQYISTAGFSPHSNTYSSTTCGFVQHIVFQD